MSNKFKVGDVVRLNPAKSSIRNEIEVAPLLVVEVRESHEGREPFNGGILLCRETGW